MTTMIDATDQTTDPGQRSPAGPADGKCQEHASELTAAGASSVPLRTPPPTTALGTTLRFAIGVEHGYLTVCERDDGTPCAIFVCLAKHGDELRGALDAWARLFSVALQYGVPLADLCGKFKHQRFEPNGWTNVEGIGFATSIPDLVVRWLERRYLGSAVAGDVAATDAGQEPG